MDIALACLDLPFGLALCAGRLDQLVQSGRVLHVSSLLILRPAAECPPRSLSSRVTDHTPSGLGSQSASHMSISVTLPPPHGVSLSTVAEAVTPRISSALAHWFLLWQSTLGRQRKSNQMQGITFSPSVALLSRSRGCLKDSLCIMSFHSRCTFTSWQQLGSVITFQWVSNALMQIPALTAFIFKTMTFPKKCVKMAIMVNLEK